MQSHPRFLAIVALVVLGALMVPGSARSDLVPVQGSTGVQGIALKMQDGNGVTVHFEIGSYELSPLEIRGETLQKVSIPGVFLPNDAGAPDLPGTGRFIALPQGASARLEIVSSTTRTLHNVQIAPAMVIPKETDDGPPIYEKNLEIYGRNASYPQSPVLLSAPGQMRGLDIVTLGITPFQYNPVTRDLIVYTELEVRVSFHEGNGRFGVDRLRNRYWEPVLERQILNYATLPQVDFSRPRGARTGVEYIIICPDNPNFIAWADTLKNWRTLQGITTDVFTTTEIGGTTPTIIENWLNNAYNTWDPAPVAFLILADYPASGLRDTGVTSPIWNSYCVSDNMFADVNGDDLPDMFHGRITARNAAELQTMVGKQLTYERHPYTDAAYYDHPVIAGGWQTERWFILCAEVVYGHQAVALGKHPIREYAIYSGTPGTLWSTATNTATVVNYFGPSGLGYIPATPQHLTDWGGDATRINNDLNAGAYFLIHRDHGMETGWGEPAYNNVNLSGLHNDKLPFVFSMNCLTGKYNYSGECFTEAFHRMAQGAVGLIAASEISYSFVNDTYIWGMWDTMWPNFMPNYGPYPPQSHFAADLRPAFGMAAGKYFLQSSSWPYNTGDKQVTYHLFHNHGDVFFTMFSEVPQDLAVQHDNVLFLGLTQFNVRANLGASIALTVNGEIIGTADATGLPQNVPILPQNQPGIMRITITKANYYRYVQEVQILPPTGPYLVLQGTSLLDSGGDADGQADAGETFDLNVTCKNVGVDPTTAVSGTITSTDPYAQILIGQRSFPNMPPGAEGTCLEPFSLRLAGNVPDQHPVPFDLTAQSLEGSWPMSFSLTGQAPVLAVTQPLVDDSPPGGNGNGRPDPGETILLDFWLSNTGHSAAGQLSGTLTCGDANVIVHDGDGESMGVPVGGQGMLSGFRVEILSPCPSPAQVPFHLSLSAANGFGAEIDHVIDVGPWSDNAETDRGWSLTGPGDTATTGLWIWDDPVGTTYNGQPVQPEDDHTADPGHICFVTGNGPVGGAAGENDLDGGKTTLTSPVFALANATAATLSYWRWYTNNLGNAPNADYWDVDVTSNGTNWVHLEHTTNSANSWNQYTFDLQNYVTLTNQVRIRFVADDQLPNSLIEAAVDDIMLSAIQPPSAGLPASDVPASTGIVSCRPNPLHGNANIVYRLREKSPVRLTLFDVSGRALRTLVHQPVDAGLHSVVLDGLDGNGHPLSSGIYFLRLETPGLMQVKQVALVK